MFSWSQNGSSGGGNQYPGRRMKRGSNNPAAATAVEGSIRPPADFTRAQHLESYLEDATLKRSTRKVSAGT